MRTRIKSLNVAFPTAWKQAIDTPIFKYGDHYEVSNYSAISILPVLSKVAGKNVSEQLTSLFRVNYSTETATLRLIQQIKSKIDRGISWCCIFRIA